MRLSDNTWENLDGDVSLTFLSAPFRLFSLDALPWMLQTVRLLTILCLALSLSACTRHSIHLKIIGDDGLPVASASVTFRWMTGEPWGPSVRSGGSHSESAISDSLGFASAGIDAENYAKIDVCRPDYYAASVVFDNSRLTHHQTEATAFLISLKRVINPCPLVAKKAYIILPTLSGNVAYDFQKGDIVAPYGRGSIADVKLVWSRPPDHSKTEKRQHYEMLFETPGSGIIAQRISNDNALVQSSLRSERLAPLNGYESSIRDAETRAGFGESGAGCQEGVVYYIRIARDGGFCYGKILGEPKVVFYNASTHPVIELTYALNPSGDRSLEPDLKTVSFPKSNDKEGSYKLPEYAY